MLIESLQLTSYGPFADSGNVTFAEGVNLLVGQNNSGKSAVLKSLRRDAINWPHRNLQRYREIDLLPSVQRLKVRVSGAELRDAFMSRGGEVHFPTRGPLEGADVDAFTDEFFGGDRSYHFDFYRQHTDYRRVEPGPSHGGFPDATEWSVHLSASRPTFIIGAARSDNLDTLVELMLPLWDLNVFGFDAERLSIGRCQQQDAERLAPNAANLPAVLQRLQGRQPGLFQMLEARVREVLPSVYGIRATPVGGNDVEIIVWPTAHMDKPEHGFTLNESGTGVAQVLAILTAVMTREHSVIVIDEINSFLHPAAVKALLRILISEFQSNQYVLSTHSAEVISSSNPATLHVVKRDGFDSVCQAVSTGDVSELRDLSDLLGISIGDIFAADRVLWVEGRTEELCFPFLLNHWGLALPRGLIISPVVATGDFAGKKDLNRVLAIYKRLSQVTLPLVRSVTFSFDSEDLGEAAQSDLTKRANGRLLFLPRRHLECYLLDPDAIAEFINKRDVDHEPIGRAVVEAEMLKRGGEGKYRAKHVWKGALTDEPWLREVDAAKLIAETITSLSAARVTFNKTTDTLELLESVANARPAALRGLQEYLKKLLDLVRCD